MTLQTKEETIQGEIPLNLSDDSTIFNQTKIQVTGTDEKLIETPVLTKKYTRKEIVKKRFGWVVDIILVLFFVLSLMIFIIGLFSTSLCGGATSEQFWMTVLSAGTSTALSKCQAENIWQSLLLIAPWFFIFSIFQFIVQTRLHHWFN